LDIKTLGGAGFASQRTTGEDRQWNLSAYHGIELVFDSRKSDSKQYTLILKDTLLPKNPDNGREQATISWEYDFQATNSAEATQGEATHHTIFIPWAKFKPTYRGKEQKDVKPFDQASIRRISIMMRR